MTKREKTETFLKEKGKFLNLSAISRHIGFINKTKLADIVAENGRRKLNETEIQKFYVFLKHELCVL